MLSARNISTLCTKILADLELNASIPTENSTGLTSPFHFKLVLGKTFFQIFEDVIRKYLRKSIDFFRYPINY